MSNFTITIFLLFLFSSCISPEKCPQGINVLPMYGEQIKCKEQLSDDSTFITESIEEFKTRQEATKYYVEKGWEYFYAGDHETSMKRFNQAWLLDSMNADVYWGIGNLLGSKHKVQESLPLFEKSIKLNPNRAEVYENLATSYGQLFFETKNILFLGKSINNLKMAIQLDPKNPRALAQLTGAYCYFQQKDSAIKYLVLTDEIEPRAVNPEVRKMLMED